MITKDNYTSTINNVDISALPEMLREGHEFFLESVEFYDEDKDIRETIDLYLNKLNEYLSYRKDNKETIIRDFYAQLSKTEVANLRKNGLSTSKKKLADTLNISQDELLEFDEKIRPKAKRDSPRNEPKTKKPPKAKKTSEETEKETVPPKFVENLDEEVKFIKRFIGFHNKSKQLSSVLSYIKSLQKAIVQKLIRKSSPYADEVRIIQDKLVKLYNNSNPNSEVRLVINESDLAKYVGIVGGEAVYKSVAVIKRFIGMQGKGLEADKIEAFLKYVGKAGITSEDPYFDRVQSIVNQVKKYKQGTLKVSDQELNGLMGIIEGCNCNLGKIYDTGEKELRKCRSKKYSDAKRGACSHNQGVKKVKCNELNGVMTAEQVAKMEFEKLNLTGKWAALIGQPATNFDMMIFGQPGSGKTTFLLSFGHYLATNFGSVLYVSGEEYNSAPLTEKLNLLPSLPKNLHFVKDLRNIPVGNYQFVILDSITDLGVDLESYKLMREKYPDTAFILILQTTKDGKFKGGKEWEHEVEIAGEVDNGTISIYKNRYGVKGSLNFFED
jgi:hypothetical protein